MYPAAHPYNSMKTCRLGLSGDSGQWPAEADGWVRMEYLGEPVPND